MHEYGLAADIVAAAVAAADGHRVVRVLADIGPDTHVDPESLGDVFEMTVVGTPMAGARLELTPVATGGLAVTAVDVAA